MKRSAMLSAYDDPLFAEEEALHVLELMQVRTPRLDADTIIHRLNGLAKSFAHQAYTQAINTRTIAKDCVAVEKACGTIIALLAANGTNADDGIVDHLGGGALFGAAAVRGEASGQQSVERALMALVDLRRDAQTTMVRYRSKPGPNHKPKDVAIKSLVSGLSELLWEATGKPPSFSRRTDGTVYGPLIDLMTFFNERCWARKIDRKRSPESLGQVWTRLTDEQKMRFDRLLSEGRNPVVQ